MPWHLGRADHMKSYSLPLAILFVFILYLVSFFLVFVNLVHSVHWNYS